MTTIRKGGSWHDATWSTQISTRFLQCKKCHPKDDGTILVSSVSGPYSDRWIQYFYPRQTIRSNSLRRKRKDNCHLPKWKWFYYSYAMLIIPFFTASSASSLLKQPQLRSKSTMQAATHPSTFRIKLLFFCRVIFSTSNAKSRTLVNGKWSFAYCLTIVTRISGLCTDLILCPIPGIS